MTVSPHLPLRPLSYALDTYVLMCDRHVHQANPDTSHLLHPKVSLQFPSPHSLSCIFLKVSGTTTHTWDSWISSLPSPYTANWMISLISCTSPWVHALFYFLESLLDPDTHQFLYKLFMLLLISDLAFHYPSTTNTLHPPQIWTCQFSEFFKVLLGLEQGKLWPMGQIWLIFCFCTNKTHVQTQLFHCVKVAINNEEWRRLEYFWKRV